MKTSQVFTSKYLKHTDLPGPVEYTIRSATGVEFDGDKKIAITFVQTPKTFLVNFTNTRVIETLYGDDMDNWVGKKITLYPSETTFQGSVRPCIRVQRNMPSSGPAKVASKTPATSFEHNTVEEEM